MAGPPLTKARKAHYHVVKATALWAAFRAAEQAEAFRSADARARQVAQRKRETTYARGELGGS